MARQDKPKIISLGTPPQGTLPKIGYALKWGRKFGFKELLKKPFQLAFADLIIRSKKNSYFLLNNKVYRLFYHKYNCTWLKERAVEIPLAKEFLLENQRQTKLLEVGNVLSNYLPLEWDVVDKFERGEKIIQEDIELFAPKIKYDKIIAISTFEHIGFDSEPNPEFSGEKIRKAFSNLVENCLNQGGMVLLTVPIGYNPYMDKIALDNELNFTKCSFLKKVAKNDWKQVTVEEASKCVYGKPFPYANCIFIGEFIKSKKM